MNLDNAMAEFIEIRTIPIFGVSNVQGYSDALPGWHPKELMPKRELFGLFDSFGMGVGGFGGFSLTTSLTHAKGVTNAARYVPSERSTYLWNLAQGTIENDVLDSS